MSTTTAATTTKKPKISTFRRLLWHANRTDLGWALKLALSVADRGRPERRRLLASLPSHPDWSAGSRAIAHDGYVDVTSIVDRDLAEACLAHANEKVSRWETLRSSQKLGHKSFWISLLDEDLVNGGFPSDHSFVRYALQPSVLRVVGEFMGELPILDDVLLTLSRPSEDQQLSYSQLWHLDHDDKRVCKLFIYLSDVESIEDGPFTFVPARESSRFRNSLKSHMTDERVFSRISRDAVKQMIAPRLTSFIVNTARCLHMGSRIAPEHSRLLYTATYIQAPRIFPDPPPRFRAVSATPEYERVAMRL